MYGPKWPFLLILNCIWTQCGRCQNLGQVVPWVELPVQRRLCPIFHEWCRVIRHPQIFRGLTGCQRDTAVLGRHRPDGVEQHRSQIPQFRDQVAQTKQKPRSSNWQDNKKSDKINQATFVYQRRSQC